MQCLSESGSAGEQMPALPRVRLGLRGRSTRSKDSGAKDTERPNQRSVGLGAKMRSRPAARWVQGSSKTLEKQHLFFFTHRAQCPYSVEKIYLHRSTNFKVQLEAGTP